jgi:hypothetical protein
MNAIRIVSRLTAASLVILPAALAGQTNPDTGVTGVCVSNCGTGSSSSSSSNGGLIGSLIHEMFRDRSDERRARGTQINNQAVEIERAGNLEEALRLYRQALELNPGSAMIRRNIASVLTQIASRDVAAAHYRERNEAALAGAEARLAEADRYNVQGGPDHQQIAGWIAQTRTAIAEARAYAAREARNKRLLADSSVRISTITTDISQSLAAEAGASQARAQSLGFGDPSAGGTALAQAPAPAPAPIVSSDPMVVDARGRGALPPGVPRLEEVENSPGQEAWLRGMDAVVQRDWQLAQAWFETALQRDPTNLALGRAVLLARWAREGPQPERPAGAASSPPPTSSAPLQDRAAPLRKWDALARRPAKPHDSDLSLLFPGPETPRELETRAPLAGESARIFDDHLAEISAVLAAAEADGEFSIEERERIDLARQTMADQLEADARQLFGAGDVAGALALLDRADQQWPFDPRYGRIRDALRPSAAAPASAQTADAAGQAMTGLAPGATIPAPAPR